MGKIRQKILEEIGFLIACGCMVLFSGCAPKTVGASDSSSKIINGYLKKELPIGWNYNFGIGSSYGNAMEDANKTKTMEYMSKVEMTATHYSNFKDIRIKDNTMFGVIDFCEVKETWDIPEGTLIVRLCPDVSYFQKDYSLYLKNHDIQKNVDFSFTLGRVMGYIDKKMKNRPNPKEDLSYLLAFKIESREMDTRIAAANFYEDSDEMIIAWLETSYKEWFNKLGSFKDLTIKRHYGIMYPYQNCPEVQYKLGYMPNQFWKLKETGVTVSRTYKLSEVQLSGHIPIPESKWFEYIGR